MSLKKESTLNLIFIELFCLLVIWLVLKWKKKVDERNAKIIVGQIDFSTISKIRLWGIIITASTVFVLSFYEIAKRIYNYYY
ncbi:hypothetical protein ACFX5F_16180 [Flavobacterium sp. ZS1P70]|uniref:DUF1206 domain-containing protein n=1 Tax=Flavobacterium zhoui TaxID=3230414 RepID=A0ABW6I8Y8_9FLAO